MERVGDFDVAADICNPWLYYTSPYLDIRLFSTYLGILWYSIESRVTSPHYLISFLPTFQAWAR